MITVLREGAWMFDGRIARDSAAARNRARERLGEQTARGGISAEAALRAEGRKGTIAWGILAAHNRGTEERLRLVFDALASHDITFVNIIQTARACGLERFPVPYVLTNCHNALAAVGGTINEDDHVFGRSAAEKYGGIFVPPHLAVIHSYIREAMAGCGRMILGSDSHTRYGPLGVMGVGEGGGELVKQLLGQTYDITLPEIIGVELSGTPRNGVGPEDVALSLVRAVFHDGVVKNAVLEFFGPGVANLSAEFRFGIDVMTTETAAWSSVWETDGVIRDYLACHNRPDDFRPLSPAATAYYDKLIRIDLSAIRPVIALPFHPGNVYEITTLLENAEDIFHQVEKDAADMLGGAARFSLAGKIEKTGGRARVRVDQGIVAGCAGGTFENIMTMRDIIKSRAAENGAAGNGAAGDGIPLSVYPGSQPILLALAQNGALADLAASGVIMRTAFCGPCFGAGDVPAHNGFSIRHTTRNFPNREGSRPQDGQTASVALMDARSVAATWANGGYLTPAEGLVPEGEAREAYRYDDSPYRARVYRGFAAPRPETPLILGPNITDWPPMDSLGEHLLVRVAAFLTDPVTTTDELIPSGETSSYRSNPVALARFTLSRRDPGYTGRADKARAEEDARRRAAEYGAGLPPGTLREFPQAGTREMRALFEELKKLPLSAALDLRDLRIGSAIYAVKPGDGSAREQAASAQKVLGGWANFAREYATKRYRSNLINWGIVPFIVAGEPVFARDDYVFIPRLRSTLAADPPPGGAELDAWALRPLPVSPDTNEIVFMVKRFSLPVPVLDPGERAALLAGSLINLNRTSGA
ncbi:MAG: hydratase [Spirochaetaceae bacterium]|jgi:aconitate hydratase|nr:hydratase [Spirochaetaceae bacterium]